MQGVRAAVFGCGCEPDVGMPGECTAAQSEVVMIHDRLVQTTRRVGSPSSGCRCRSCSPLPGDAKKPSRYDASFRSRLAGLGGIFVHDWRDPGASEVLMWCGTVRGLLHSAYAQARRRRSESRLRIRPRAWCTHKVLLERRSRHVAGARSYGRRWSVGYAAWGRSHRDLVSHTRPLLAGAVAGTRLLGDTSDVCPVARGSHAVPCGRVLGRPLRECEHRCPRYSSSVSL